VQIKPREVFDAIVVGSGASGGIVAYELSKAGATVCLLEAGPNRDKDKDFPYHKWPYDFPFRGRVSPREVKPAPFLTRSAFDAQYIFSHHDLEPYTWAENLPYIWWRARVVGGRTHFWGRICWRLNEHDFQPFTYDGHGVDWPLRYQDVVPYYERIERFVGICGEKENHPDTPDGIYLPSPKPNCNEVMIRKAADQAGFGWITTRKAHLTRAHGGYAACHYCAHCNQGCETGSYFNSYDRCIPPAMKTGKLRLIVNALAAEIFLDPKTGLAAGVSYMDTKHHQEYKVYGKTVVVAGGTLHSARLLLGSRSRQFPTGIANSSGQVGRNFMEHADVDASGLLPQLRNRKPVNDDGIGSITIIPWNGWGRKDVGFVRGYHIEAGGRFSMFPNHAGMLPGFGSAYKKAIHEWYGTYINFHAHLEMLPDPRNFVELDPELKDAWGIPVLKIHLDFHDNERKMIRHCIERYKELFHILKAEYADIPDGPLYRGASIHELGTARMGADPKTSVVNSFGQAHDVKNLYVVDGSIFPSATHKNPTETIMALALRASDHMQERLKGRV
jgi:choline dehydrogenase-like flavoprotein